jgi:hypothetical protein
MRNPAPTPAKLGQTAVHTTATTAAGLFRLLGVQHASVMRQRVALSEWLESNSATAELRQSLRANGYGLLLPRPERRTRPQVRIAAQGRAS